MSFEYLSPTKIIYGVDRIKSIGHDVKKICGKCNVVLVTDPGIIKVDIAEEVVAYLKDAGMRVSIYSGVKSYPTTDSIDDAADMIRNTGSKCVIGLGGGSAMDVAKIAAVVALDDRPVVDYAMCTNSFKTKTIKTIMVPTTAGTGAEVTPTVLFSLPNGRKVWSMDTQMIPDVAVLDPALTAALPPHLTAATGLDAFVHAYESVTGKRSNQMIQAVGLHAIKLVSRSLIKAIKEPTDLKARGDLIVAAMMAGLAAAAGGTGVAHCVGHALGAAAQIHHGRAVTLVLDKAYKMNVQAAIDIHAEVAKAFGVNNDGRSNEEVAYAGAEAFHKLIIDSGLKTSLEGELEDVDELIEHIFKPENQPMRNNNCKYFDDEELKELARLL